MVNLRTQVGKVQISGTIGTGSSPAEIWSTGFWVAPYGGGVSDMSLFEPASYITDHVVPLVTAMMANSSGAFTATLIKCNVFGFTAGKVKQITDPTVELVVNTAGTGDASYTTNVTAFGWRLQTSGGSRGVGTQGRMFLPPQQSSGSYGPFDGNGHYLPAVVAAVSTVMTAAWTGLSAAGGSLPAGTTYLPSVVHVPKPATLPTEFTVNGADITTAENNVWVLRSRKNALDSGGVKTTHPSFS